MPNLAVVLKQEISRLARKEMRSQTQRLRKAAAQYRRDIAGLKRHASALRTAVARLERQAGTNASPVVGDDQAQGIRFTAKGLRSQRKRLGISAAGYARLAGVTAHTVYKWEHGAARPRRRQLTTLASLRRLGKKEALERLQRPSGKSSKGRKKKR